MTPSSESTLTLAGEFPPASRDEWRELVAGVLRKAGRLPEDLSGPVEDLIATRLADGVTVSPLYTAEDAAPEAGVPGVSPFTRGATALGASPDGWDIRQRHADPDAGTTREAVLADLENGVTSLWLALGDGALPVDSLAGVLAEVYLDLAPIVLDAGDHTRAATDALFALAAERDVPKDALRGCLGVDPFAWLAARDSDTDVDAGLTLAGELAQRCLAERPSVRAVSVDATVFHNAGADEAHELGYSLAAGVAYLRALTAAGLSEADSFAQLEFRYAATTDQFATIAKLRAARTLWARVAKECGVDGPSSAQRQHAVSSEQVLTARDPWVNMLRGTLAGFGAGVGGADAVTVLPFDAALGLPDKFARRIARNTQSLLVSESHLARVLDPAGGSWYVENLTDQLARRAWEVFTEVERGGGLAEALRGGSVADTLRELWDARERRLATRKEPITGVSEFPNVAEKLPTRTAAPAPSSTGLLPRVRRAAAFESLRDRTDAHERTSGSRPSVFLATVGSPASYAARSGFASNLFQVGGLVTPTGGGEAEAIAEAFRESGASVACLCGADKTYAEQAEPVVAALRDAGASKVLLAGKPGTLSEGAVDGYVYAGCDAVEVLTGVLEELGVSS
ncbi:MAG TPA: methylmalonyl-CoA mutase family protein [Pseudonocardia sp.]|jgi:methylmalonyl-CoA mutase|nr:methylmalonyl-CoA mutase family protein [Pseudonocardia sp.]